MRFRFDPTISYGNILQSFLIVIGVLTAWFEVRTDLKTTKADVARHEIAINLASHAAEKVAQTQNLLGQNLSVLTAIVDERTKRDKEHPKL